MRTQDVGRASVPRRSRRTAIDTESSQVSVVQSPRRRSGGHAHNDQEGRSLADTLGFRGSCRDHRIRQESAVQGATRRPSLLALTSRLDESRLELVAGSSALELRLSHLFQRKFWITERYECKFAEATLSGSGSSAHHQQRNLPRFGISARLWREHSPPHELIGCFRYRKTGRTRSVVGRQTDTINRTCVRREGASVSCVQDGKDVLRRACKHARGDRSDGILLKLGFSSDLVQEQLSRLRRTRGFVPQQNELSGPHEEEVEEAEEEEEK